MSPLLQSLDIPHRFVVVVSLKKCFNSHCTMASPLLQDHDLCGGHVAAVKECLNSYCTMMSPLLQDHDLCGGHVAAVKECFNTHCTMMSPLLQDHDLCGGHVAAVKECFNSHCIMVRPLLQDHDPWDRESPKRCDKSPTTTHYHRGFVQAEISLRLFGARRTRPKPVYSTGFGQGCYPLH